ncbi:MAG: tRNA uridine-5-carboxymethylaminomethyl(34) synthesis GTPase MnmE [Pseudomonadota bacterium]|nr:tRNA uridine-5-carboxymethylaminomethyl(34) synthesis GTPase MnmE [Pseudomonadota bacterium]
MLYDTIFALASGGGKVGVAVYRVSGPGAATVFQALTASSLPEARRAVRVRVADGKGGDIIDYGLALWFPAPGSFTGEDVLEFHLHGGRAVNTAMLEVLAALPGLRPAEAGEFTRRAFENGKLDLTEAEGLADLVEAETAAQRRQALGQIEGAIADIYDRWREDILAAIARFEAAIDFAEEDLPGGLRAEVARTVVRLDGELARHLDDGGRGQRLRDGISIAILGPPNAGKSSLLNRLANRDMALVSARAGTTRDVIEAHLDLGGYPVVLADTAGLRDASGGLDDDLESQGVHRALARAASAHLKILVFDGALWPELDNHTLEHWDRNAFVVVNKSDLSPDLQAASSVPGEAELLALSTKTGAGIDTLLARLCNRVEELCAGGGGPALTRVRHRLALEECREALQRFRETELVELAAEDLRLAARALGRITGRVDVEDILDRIFSEFCIGK